LQKREWRRVDFQSLYGSNFLIICIVWYDKQVGGTQVHVCSCEQLVWGHHVKAEWLAVRTSNCFIANPKRYSIMHRRTGYIYLPLLH